MSEEKEKLTCNCSGSLQSCPKNSPSLNVLLPFLTPVIECPIETPYCPEKLNTNRFKKGIIFLGTCLAFPLISLFIALYMWIRHPGRCINEIKKMWSNKGPSC